MTSRMIPSNFVKNQMQNGVGRYVCQLQRVTLKFCKEYVGSRGMRDFIENQLLDFTRRNPGIVVYLKPRRHRAAVITAEYLSGDVHNMSMNNRPENEICMWLSHFQTRSGVPIMRLRKKWHTDTPSVQGIWHPALNRDSECNVTSFPDSELGRHKVASPTATEKLLLKAKELREKEKLLLHEDNR